jgi:hypothetical protein
VSSETEIQQAIQDSLDDGELVINWVLTVDIAGPDDMRYLAHRSGGGVDGTDHPMIWTALGMINAAKLVAESQAISATYGEDEEEEEETSEGEE